MTAEAKDPEVIEPGPFTLKAPCPECGLVAHFPVELDIRLSVDSGGSKLRPMLRTKAIEHRCNAPDNAIPLFGNGAADE